MNHREEFDWDALDEYGRSDRWNIPTLLAALVVLGPLCIGGVAAVMSVVL